MSCRTELVRFVKKASKQTRTRYTRTTHWVCAACSSSECQLDTLSADPTSTLFLSGSPSSVKAHCASPTPGLIQSLPPTYSTIVLSNNALSKRN